MEIRQLNACSNGNHMMMCGAMRMRMCMPKAVCSRRILL